MSRASQLGTIVRFRRVTLTTFREVAWNAAWYQRRGFQVLGEDEVTPALRRLRSIEDGHGLPAELRVVMRLDLDTPASATTRLPGQATLVECWRALAQLSPGARVIHAPGTVAAMFPEWAPLNNAIVLEEGDPAADLAAAELSARYRRAGIEEWAAWVPSTELSLDGPDTVLRVGSLTRDTTTLVMHATLGPTVRPHRGVVETSIEEERSARPPSAAGARDAARWEGDDMTVDVQTEIVIEHPLDAVAAYATDPSNAPEWYDNIDSVEWQGSPPATVGTAVTFVARFLGRRLEYTYEIVELAPSARLVMRTQQGPFPMETTYTWRAEGKDATHMTLRNRGEPAGFSRLFAPMMEPAMRRANRKDLAKLKRILEARPE